MANSQPVYFLHEYAEKVLTDLGLGEMSQTEKDRYIPQLSHQIEYRLGAALLPLVPNSAAPVFQKLLDAEVSAEEWQKFWQTTVPNFEQVVKTVLHDFAIECEKILV